MDMVAAQTGQSLPPLQHFSGEETQAVFDRWIELFEERAKLVGWSDEHRKYNLKMLLDKADLQVVARHS